MVRESGFDISVASEIMAILCLAKDLEDLRRRLEDVLLGITCEGKPFYLRDLGSVGSILVILKDALQPNLVQTTENTPAFIHGGPFANIAHGCNSLIATKMAMSHSDYTVTELASPPTWVPRSSSTSSAAWVAFVRNSAYWS